MISTSNRKLLALGLALALATPLALAAQTAVLPSASGSDTLPARLAPGPTPTRNLERAPIQFAWRLDPAAAVEPPAPFVHESREFWASVPADQLRSGYDIDTTAAGAVIRVSPAPGARAQSVRLDDLQLQVGGRTVSGAQAFERAVDADALRQAGADFPEGTIAFRIAPELGSGRVSLRQPNARGDVLVHVFEPESPVRMLLTTGTTSAHAGGRLEVSSRLYDGDSLIQAGRMGGVLTAPDGRSFAFEFDAGAKGESLARVDLPVEASSVPGLWEVHAFAVSEDGQRRLLRDAKTAVSVAAPTARLAGEYRSSEGDGLRFDFDVEAADAGRYEVRAVLFGTDGRGQLRPMANAHSAAWLEAGPGSIELHYPAEVLDARLRAPYELRELTLSDQGRMGRLEQRAVGPRVDAPPSPRPRSRR